MNNIYIYDGKFSSLLSLIMTVISSKINPSDIKSKNEFVPNLLDTPVYLKLDNKEENLNLLRYKTSKEIIHTCYYAFLSNDKDKEMIIYYFLKNAFKYKNEVYFHKNLNCVNKIISLSKYVSNEAHKLKGFLRFKEMENNFYYAEISPSNNVIGILSKHFQKRLSNENWIIKDVKRQTYAIYDAKKIYFLTNEEVKKLNLNFSKSEKEYENLWKTFFKTIGIKERKNLKCQRNFMPKKYWNYIIEMEDYK